MASNASKASLGPMPPAAAPLSISFIQQAERDLPVMYEQKAKLVHKVGLWEKLLERARQELRDHDLKITRKEAFLASAVESMEQTAAREREREREGDFGNKVLSS